jgi:hypothetical protein
MSPGIRPAAPGWHDDFDPLPSDPNCTHREVRSAYVERTGKPIALWSCADCGRRFVPRRAGATAEALGSIHPYPPTKGPPDEDMRQRLHWSNRWMSADGAIRSMEAMLTGHLWAVLGYLRWYAVELAIGRGTEPGDLAAPNVRRWLSGRPIWRAIAGELRRRGEIYLPSGSADLAMHHLEEQGAVPWEHSAPDQVCSSSPIHGPARNCHSSSPSTRME